MKEFIEKFQELTSKNLQEYLLKSSVFLKTDYPNIVRFYSGKVKSIDSKTIQNFEDIRGETKLVLELFEQHSRQMNNTAWWDLLAVVEEINTRLSTLLNMNRWTRSSLTKTAYSSSIQIQHTLKQKQTLESVSKNVLLSNNPQDSWLDIAYSNRLREEDYTIEGGVDLNLEIEREVNKNIEVKSVVDTLSGKSIFGKDIDKRLTFEDDDLKVLGYEDTLTQSVEILVSLKKGDHPDYPNLGIQKDVLVGGSRASLNFPVVIRQLNEVFASDDSLKDFQVKTLEIKADNAYIDYTVSSMLGEVDTSPIMV